MNTKDAIIKAMEEYQRITGLRSYLIQDVDDINSAAERNYFCKCLKTSARALKHEGADVLLDYATSPSLRLYSSGLNAPNDNLIRFEAYH